MSSRSPSGSQPRKGSSARGSRTRAVYYRDERRREPVNEWIETLNMTNPAAAAKIDDYVEEYLNDRRVDEPPPEYPITSQIAGGLRELRVRFAKTRYRLLYQRSGNLVILLHALEKNTGSVPRRDKDLAQRRFRDFQARMDAQPRKPPRAAGHDAPPKRRA